MSLIHQCHRQTVRRTDRRMTCNRKNGTLHYSVSHGKNCLTQFVKCGNAGQSALPSLVKTRNLQQNIPPANKIENLEKKLHEFILTYESEEYIQKLNLTSKARH